MLGLALAAGSALSLPALWWEPLHLDEAITLQFARRSYGAIAEDIFVERGGAPVHFMLEHATLSWPGGIEGLRLPSVLFFLATIVLTVLLVRRLVSEVALLAAVFVAVAPLGLGLSTFARMYSLFVAAVLATTLLAVRAARTGAHRDWIVAGVTAGALVYVHPIAPLYSALAVATGFLTAGRPLRRVASEAWPGAVAAVAVAAPYVYALAVLRSRYDVVLESGRIRTTAGRSVPEEALHALTPGGTAGALAFLALGAVGLIWLGRDRPRVSVALGLWLLVPVAFFTLVPANTRFFGRYLAPAEPFFYVLVGAGCVALAGRRRVVAMTVAAIVVAVSVAERIDKLATIHSLGLRDLAAAVDADSVIFSSTGTPVSDRPPELLDDYLELEDRAARRVEELPGIDLRFEKNLAGRGGARIRTFLASDQERRGVWVFRGPDRRVTRALRRLGDDGELESVRPSGTLLVIRSRKPGAPAALVEQGLRARTAWTLASPSDRWTTLLLEIGRAQAGKSP